MGIDIKRGLTKAETVAIASLPDLPTSALAILASACEAPGKAAPLALGPERGVWFRAQCAAFEAAQLLGADLRWGGNQVRVQVPAKWTTYLDRTGKVKRGNTIQQVPAPAYWPGGVLPAGAHNLGDVK